MIQIYTLSDESKSQELAYKITLMSIKTLAQKSFSIHLNGDLGVGKTTFARYLLNSLGYEGLVKSPTYSLIESYKIGPFVVHHLDLYRLSSFEELDFLDFESCFCPGNLVMIEWANLFEKDLPKANLVMNFTYQGIREAKGAESSQNQAQSNDFLRAVELIFND